MAKRQPTESEIEEAHEESNYWQNELDAKKYLIQVHDEKFKEVLGEDFKLAKLDDGEITKKQEFVMEMLGVANMAIGLVPNPDIAMEIQHMDMLYLKALAVLNFNRDKNMIIDRVTGWGSEKPDTEEKRQEANLWERIKTKLKGEKEEER